MCVLQITIFQPKNLNLKMIRRYNKHSAPEIQNPQYIIRQINLLSSASQIFQNLDNTPIIQPIIIQIYSLYFFHLFQRFRYRKRIINPEFLMSQQHIPSRRPIIIFLILLLLIILQYSNLPRP